MTKNSKRKNPHAVALGRLGGKSRAAKLPRKRQREIALIGSLIAKLKRVLDGKDKAVAE